MRRLPAGMSTDRRRATDVLLLVTAVAAVSTSAPLIRQAAAPSLTIALWRTTLGAAATAPVALPQRVRLPVRSKRLVAAAGVTLAAHFATWISSLSYTSVASAVTLVSMQPLWAALLSRQPVHRRTWVGIAIAVSGAVAIAGVDFGISSRALVGDGLALVGGALAALYVTIGAEVRKTVPTATYTTGCYAAAAITLLLVALLGGVGIVPSSGATWGWLVAITVGPQLLGHTLINAVLQRVDAVLVSVSILFEILGATALAWWWFGESPPVAIYPASVLLVSGLILVISGGRRLPPSLD